jgi:hypothetical protein
MGWTKTEPLTSPTRKQFKITSFPTWKAPTPHTKVSKPEKPPAPNKPYDTTTVCVFTKRRP